MDNERSESNKQSVRPTVSSTDPYTVPTVDERPPPGPVATKTPDFVVSDRCPLTDAELEEACKDCIFVHPSTCKSMVDPPVLGAKVGIVSMMLFKTPRWFKATGKPLYGFMKIRKGLYPDERAATDAASDIIRTFDDKFKNHIAPVGMWVPITEERAFSKDLYDVRVADQEKHLRDQAVKDKQAEERKILNELKSREEQMREELEADPEEYEISLEYYVKRRVTEMSLTNEIERAKAKLEEMKASAQKVRRNIKDLDRYSAKLKDSDPSHVEYKDAWLDVYNKSRRESGFADFVPTKKQFAELGDV